MKNLLKLLAKSVLLPLGLTVAASATDAAIQKKILGSGMTTLIISNIEVEDIIKIVNPLDPRLFCQITKESTKAHICKNTDFCENNHRKLYIF